MSQSNDINIVDWDSEANKDLITESWWPFDSNARRPETGDYHGCMISQVPNQLIRRLSKRDDWVLDPMVGSGTTTIEAAYLRRRSVGIDLNPAILERAARATEAAFKRGRPKEMAGMAPDRHLFRVADARTFDYSTLMSEPARLVVLHPPYHDILAFSESPEDLSRNQSIDRFLIELRRCVNNLMPWLDPGGHLALVIGDYYRNSEWVPLGFKCLDTLTCRELTLKAINVKRTCETRGKSGVRSLWRRRCLQHGLTTFGHEYIFVWRKREVTGSVRIGKLLTRLRPLLP